MTSWNIHFFKFQIIDITLEIFMKVVKYNCELFLLQVVHIMLTNIVKLLNGQFALIHRMEEFILNFAPKGHQLNDNTQNIYLDRKMHKF